MRRTVWWLAVLVVAVCAPVAGAERIERSLEERFPVAEGESLRLVHGDGDVTVAPWDRPEVEVTVDYRARHRTIGWGGDGDLELELSHRRGVHTVRLDERRGISFGFTSFHRDRFEVRVQAPPWLRLELTGDDGDVSLAGWRAPVALRLEDGDVRVDDLRAPRLEVEIDDGDVELRRVRAALEGSSEDGDWTVTGSTLGRSTLRTDDGDLTVERSSADELRIVTEDGRTELLGLTAPRLEVRSDDGAITIDLAGPAAPLLTVRTDDGPVELVLPEAISASVRVRRDDGRVTIDPALLRGAPAEEDERSVRAVLGSGDGSIEVTTQDGRVELRARPPR